ncbi:MAG: EF-hand domain-containing protein [Phycisphaerales bacterium]|nr:EF-hand domain-containing protein [Phycisphaerales bacterium]
MTDATTMSWRARWPLRAAAAFAMTALAVPASGQWIRGPELGSGTPDSAVRAMQEYGPALVLGGEFVQIGGSTRPYLAVWDGWTYTTPFQFTVDGPVYAMTIHDGELVVGGRFAMAGGVEVSNIARWSSATESWSTLDGPLGEGVNGPVYTLLSHGDDLYIGGKFDSAAGIPNFDNIAVWRKADSNWLPLNGGVDGAVRSLALYQEPAMASPAVFVGGDFVNADNMLAFITVNHIARWRPGMPYGIWSPVGADPAPGVDRTVRALAVFDEDGPVGTPPALFVGGDFVAAGGMAVEYIARWNGAAWSPMNPFTAMQPDAPVHALRVQGDRLVAGGEFTSIGAGPYRHIAAWSAGAWSVVGTPGAELNGTVYTLADFDDGAGRDLFAGGAFTGVDPSIGRAAYIADLEKTVPGEEWTIPSAGLNGPVLAWAEFGGELFATGEFTVAGGRAVNYVARWNGDVWMPVGAGLNGPGLAMLVYAEPAGVAPRLFVGGRFTRAGDTEVRHMAAWDGLGWSDVGGGRSGPVHALAEYRGRLFAGGELTMPIGTHLAYWDGQFWTELLPDVNGTVYTLAEFADPSVNESTLLVGGSFTQVGTEAMDAPFLASWLWETGVWSPINGGQPDAAVRALLVPRVAMTPPEFYAGGEFIYAGTEPLMVNHIARWSGDAWSSLGSGLLGGPVHALAWQNGRLIAGGDFLSSGFTPVNRIGMWAGQWATMSTGVNDGVRAITMFGDEIIAGGRFTIAGDRTSEFWARWGCVVDFTHDGLVDFGDFLMFLNYYDAQDPLVDLNGDGLIDFADFLEFLNLYDIGC